MYCTFVKMGERWPSGLGSRSEVEGSSPTSVKTFIFGTLAIPFTPLCHCLSDETVKAVGPFTGVARIFVWGGAPGRCHPALHTFEALAGSCGSVSVPAASRIMGGAQSETNCKTMLVKLHLGRYF